MNQDDKTGGFAFPCPQGTGTDNGMTLRDYFAAKAMQALIRNFQDRTPDPAIPEWAYDWADGLLKARNK